MKIRKIKRTFLYVCSWKKYMGEGVGKAYFIRRFNYKQIR